MRPLPEAIRWTLALTSIAASVACGGPDGADRIALDSSLYALVSTAEGVYFYPPLGPDPTFSGTFDATLLEHLRVVLETTDAGGATQVLATFDASSQPALKLLGAHDMYFVNVPAATYFTDPSLSYRFRVLRDDAEIGRSDMSPHVFTVLEWVPALMVGVKVRIEQPVPRSFRFSVCIDGTDYLRIRGDRLWIAHGGSSEAVQGGMPGAGGECPREYRGYAYVNGAPWRLTWSAGLSGLFTPSPAPLPASPTTISLSPVSARGVVTVSQQPTAANGFEGAIRIQDGAWGWAVYDLVVSYSPQ